MKTTFAGLLAIALAVSANAEIIIGQTTVLTGGAAANVAEVNLGAKLVLDEVNAAGGIRGQRIRVVSLDDGARGEVAAANAEKLVTEHKAVALFLSRSTPTALAMRDVLTQHGVPLIAPSTGAGALHRPVHPYIYNLRSSYQAEVKKAIEVLVTMGLGNDIGIIAVDDAFGDDAIQGADAAKTRPRFVERFSYATGDVSKAVAQVKATGVRAVVIIGSTHPTVAAIKAIRKGNSAPPTIITISNNASDTFIKALGEDKAGVIVTQVFPSENAIDMPLVRDTMAMLKKAKPGARVTAAVLEGAAAARLLVEALKNVNGPVTSRSLQASLDSGVAFDIGWPNRSIRYTTANHTGISFADTSIVTEAGNFRR